MKPHIMDANNCDKSRRNFIKKGVLAGSALPFLHTSLMSAPRVKPNVLKPLQVHVFSKHLQFLDYHDMADAAAGIGFDGVDLTVRPKGHVLPDRVVEDLPRAVEAIRAVGLSHALMTTAVQDANDDTDRILLETGAKLGIEYYRMNWLRYSDNKMIPHAMDGFQQTIKELSHLNKKLGITGCYQNHSGNLAGASIWELWDMIQKADKQYLGVQYDIRHAVVEGGLSWQNGLRLIQPHIRMLAVKDFVWQKRNGKYAVQNVPLGQGMVDFKAYFALLKEYDINVPVSLHYEYPLGGAERGATKIDVDRKVVFDAMKKDLEWLRNEWQGR